MTEQKPVAWLFESIIGSDTYLLYASEDKPLDIIGRRNIRPVYEHPAPAQPATDPAIEKARRKALRAIFAALDAFGWSDDAWVGGYMTFGLLRDLVGQPRKDPERRIPGYDAGPDLKVSATMRETRVNTADLAQKEAIDFIAEGLEAAHAARTHTDAMWWLMTDGGKEKWRAEARVLVARAAKAI